MAIFGHNHLLFVPQQNICLRAMLRVISLRKLNSVVFLVSLYCCLCKEKKDKDVEDLTSMKKFLKHSSPKVHGSTLGLEESELMPTILQKSTSSKRNN